MARREFTKPVRRDALKRAAGRCEASGGLYGLTAGHRCNADLAYGVEFDHIDCDANSKDNSLDNCAAVCIRCHSWKTRNVDIPKTAKTLRQQDKDNGIRNSRGFRKPPEGYKYSWRTGRMEKQQQEDL